MNRSKIGWTDYSGGAANFVLRGKARGDCECWEGMGGGLVLPKVPSEAPEGVGDVDRYSV